MDKANKKYLDSKKVNIQQAESGRENWITLIHEEIKRVNSQSSLRHKPERLKKITLDCWERYKTRRKNNEFSDSAKDFYEWLYN